MTSPGENLDPIDWLATTTPWLPAMARQFEWKSGGRVSAEEFRQVALLELLTKRAQIVTGYSPEGYAYTTAKNAMWRELKAYRRSPLPLYLSTSSEDDRDPLDNYSSSSSPGRKRQLGPPDGEQPRVGVFRAGPEPEELLRYGLRAYLEAEESEGCWCKVHKPGHVAHSQVYPAVWDWLLDPIGPNEHLDETITSRVANAALDKYVRIYRWRTSPEGRYDRSRREAKGCIAWVSYAALAVPLPKTMEQEHGSLRCQLLSASAEVVASYLLIERRPGPGANSSEDDLGSMGIDPGQGARGVVFTHNREVPAALFRKICQTEPLIREAVKRRTAASGEDTTR